MDAEITPEIDPFQVRRPRRRPSRALKVLATAGALGLVFAVGGGGTYVLLGEKEPSRLPPEKLAAIRIGPVEEMPEIKDGVPALVAKPVRVIGTAPNPGQAITPAAKPAETGTRSASLEPSIDTLLNPVPTVVPKPPVVAAKPVQAAAKPVAVPVTGAEQTASITPPPIPPRAERPSVVLAAPAVAAAKPAAAPAQANGAQVLRAPAASPPPARQAAAPAPSGSNAAPAPSQVAATEDDEVRVFGVPVPGGRQIRRAAETFADAVTGLPEKF